MFRLGDMEQVEIINKFLPMKQLGMTVSDWVALIALIFSLGSLFLQGRLRRQDRREYDEIRRNDDQARRTSMIYPHRLRFLSEFSDTINKIDSAQTKQELQTIFDKLSDLERYSRLLFDKFVENKIHQVSDILRKFIDKVFENTRRNKITHTQQDQLRQIHQHIKKITPPQIFERYF